MYNDDRIVVYNGVICKWEMIKHFADHNQVRLPDKDEVRNYYAKKLDSIVVYNGVICKWDSICKFALENETRLPSFKELYHYYAHK